MTAKAKKMAVITKLAYCLRLLLLLPLLHLISCTQSSQDVTNIRFQEDARLLCLELNLPRNSQEIFAGDRGNITPRMEQPMCITDTQGNCLANYDESSSCVITVDRGNTSQLNAAMCFKFQQDISVFANISEVQLFISGSILLGSHDAYHMYNFNESFVVEHATYLPAGIIQGREACKINGLCESGNCSERCRDITAHQIEQCNAAVQDIMRSKRNRAASSVKVMTGAAKYIQSRKLLCIELYDKVIHVDGSDWFFTMPN